MAQKMRYAKSQRDLLASRQRVHAPAFSDMPRARFNAHIARVRLQLAEAGALPAISAVTV
jgi:hypothetical protein